MASAPVTKPRTAQQQSNEPDIPPLEPGDRLDQKTFHERYEAMPQGTRAELVGGIVFMPSPLKRPHGRKHLRVCHWLAEYENATPGTEAFDNASTLLDEEAEPQPDNSLLISAPDMDRRARKTNISSAPPNSSQKLRRVLWRSTCT